MRAWDGPVRCVAGMCLRISLVVPGWIPDRTWGWKIHWHQTIVSRMCSISCENGTRLRFSWKRSLWLFCRWLHLRQKTTRKSCLVRMLHSLWVPGIRAFCLALRPDMPCGNLAGSRKMSGKCRRFFQDEASAGLRRTDCALYT